MGTTGNIPKIHPDAFNGSVSSKPREVPPSTISMTFDRMMEAMTSGMKDGKRKTAQRQYQKELYRIQHNLPMEDD